MSESTVKLCECGCSEPVSIATKNNSRYGYVKGQPRRFRVGHYLRLHPLRYGHKFPPVEERFWQKVEKTEGCWIWVGSKTGNGYGVIYYNGKHEGAHRMAWILAHGEIPEGMLIRHRCDNPICVRVDHLQPGTVAENSRDMVKRGRVSHNGGCSRPGEQNPSAKLTELDVRVIRDAISAGRFSVKELAVRYGVTDTNIRHIVRRKTWSHVE